ncbi:MAG: cysteine rich repeat-containing protein [Candidatus Competibacterales bacterium]
MILPIGRFVLVLTLGFVALSTQAVATSIFEACEADIQSHCSAVTPGHGRLTACLYAHEDHLSDSCDAATGEMADVLDLVFDRLRYAKQQCSTDIHNLCADVTLGQGRVFTCLYEQREALSEGCRTLVDDVELPES